MNQFDICIIGAGPAGYTAAIYAARKNMSAIVLDKGSSGGQTANAIWMENFCPGVISKAFYSGLGNILPVIG